MPSYYAGNMQGRRQTWADQNAQDETDRRYARQIALDRRQAGLDEQAAFDRDQRIQIERDRVIQAGLRVPRIAVPEPESKEALRQMDLQKRQKMMWHANAIDTLTNMTDEELAAQGKTRQEANETAQRHQQALLAYSGSAAGLTKPTKPVDPLIQEKRQLDIDRAKQGLSLKETDRETKLSFAENQLLDTERKFTEAKQERDNRLKNSKDPATDVVLGILQQRHDTTARQLDDAKKNYMKLTGKTLPGDISTPSQPGLVEPPVNRGTGTLRVGGREVASVGMPAENSMTMGGRRVTLDSNGRQVIAQPVNTPSRPTPAGMVDPDLNGWTPVQDNPAPVQQSGSVGKPGAPNNMRLLERDELNRAKTYRQSPSQQMGILGTPKPPSRTEQAKAARDAAAEAYSYMDRIYASSKAKNLEKTNPARWKDVNDAWDKANKEYEAAREAYDNVSRGM